MRIDDSICVRCVQTFETSSESLIRGWLSISTSLKTTPKAAWA